MTDNRTFELLSLSKLKNAGKLHFWRGTIEIVESELHAICDEIQAEHEQAIAATLESKTCEYVIEDNMNETEGMGEVWFRCTNCDTWYDYLVDEWLMRVSYCPYCGAKVTKNER